MTPLPVRRSMFWWAVLAAMMIVGFYVLSIALAVVCVVAPSLLFLTSFNILYIILMLIGGLLTAATVLWSIVPRRDKFTPPGPVLRADKHPGLFSQISAMAKALREPMPTEVYLTGDLNASVMERGGWSGFGRRRIMTIGLPLIQVLTVSELQAVIAHEFGHYYGGDTRLTPWVYSTRMAMARTLNSLAGESPLTQIIENIRWAQVAQALVLVILGAYWKVFLKATQLVSRHQEYRADELAAQITGPGSLARGLRQIHAASAVVPAFWHREVGPALEAGFLPPLAAGFAQFLAAPSVASEVSAHLQHELDSISTDPLDSHPALRDRMKALHWTEDAEQPASEPSAIHLLTGLPDLERELLRTIAPNVAVSELTPIAWTDIGEAWVTNWRRFVESGRAALAGLLVSDLAAVASDIRRVVMKLPDPPGQLPTREQRADRAYGLLYAAFAVALHDHGWKLITGPATCSLTRGDQALDPAESIRLLRTGALSATAWKEMCNALELSQVRLLAR